MEIFLGRSEAFASRLLLEIKLLVVLRAIRKRLLPTGLVLRDQMHREVPPALTLTVPSRQLGSQRAANNNRKFFLADSSNTDSDHQTWPPSC